MYRKVRWTYIEQNGKLLIKNELLLCFFELTNGIFIFPWNLMASCDSGSGGGGGGGGRTRVTYFAEEVVFFMTSACPTNRWHHHCMCGGIRLGLVVTTPASPAWAGWRGRYINMRHCGGLFMVLLQLKDPLEQFVRKREFILSSRFLSRCNVAGNHSLLLKLCL